MKTIISNSHWCLVHFCCREYRGELFGLRHRICWEKQVQILTKRLALARFYSAHDTRSKHMVGEWLYFQPELTCNPAQHSASTNNFCNQDRFLLLQTCYSTMSWHASPCFTALVNAGVSSQSTPILKPSDLHMFFSFPCTQTTEKNRRRSKQVENMFPKNKHSSWR